MNLTNLGICGIIGLSTIGLTDCYNFYSKLPQKPDYFEIEKMENYYDNIHLYHKKILIEGSLSVGGIFSSIILLLGKRELEKIEDY